MRLRRRRLFDVRERFCCNAPPVDGTHRFHLHAGRSWVPLRGGCGDALRGSATCGFGDIASASDIKMQRSYDYEASSDEEEAAHHESPQSADPSRHALAVDVAPSDEADEEEFYDPELRRCSHVWSRCLPFPCLMSHLSRSQAPSLAAIALALERALSAAPASPVLAAGSGRSFRNTLNERLALRAQGLALSCAF